MNLEFGGKSSSITAFREIKYRIHAPVLYCTGDCFCVVEECWWVRVLLLGSYKLFLWGTDVDVVRSFVFPEAIPGLFSGSSWVLPKPNV